MVFFPGMRCSGEEHRPDVRLQEAGEEEDQEEKGGDDGDHGEADLAEDQLSLRGQPRLCLRDEGRPLSW